MRASPLGSVLCLSSITLSLHLGFGSSLLLARQQYIRIDPARACSYYGETPGEELAVFAPDAEATNFVAAVTKYTGIPQNFKVYAGNVRNALAHHVQATGERQIIYNQDFMRATVKSTGERWAAISIMAHEIGHHISAHPIGGVGARPKREQELEADKYSGHVLRRMNATLEQAKIAMERQPDMKAAGYPDKSARLAAIHNGWIEADEQIGSKPLPPPESQPQPQQQPRPEPQPPPTPQTGDIRLIYTGDALRCTVSVRITVGGRSITPSRNSVTLRGVPLGEQDYRISGRIGCPGWGVCDARGSGSIDVEDGEEYQVYWANTAYARCEVGLR